MKFEECEIEGLLEITPDVWKDSRGYFFESFSLQKYQTIGGLNDVTVFNKDGSVMSQHGVVNFVQDNESYSDAGTLRGLHWQADPYAQAKLVRVVSGKVWDVAVDIRKNSPTFGKWHGVELSGENKKQFFIPCGFAHGFIALENSTFAYKCTNYFNKQSERGLLWNDKDIDVKWPEFNGKLIFSEKDMKHPSLKDIVY